MSKLTWFFFLFLIAISCYLREIIFLSTNKYLEGGDIFYASTLKISFLENLTSGDLIALKIIFTIGFTILISGLTILGCKISFDTKFPFLISIATYAIIIIFCAIFCLILFIWGDKQQIYPSLRFVIEYLHSPLLFIVFSVSYFGSSLNK